MLSFTSTLSAHLPRLEFVQVHEGEQVGDPPPELAQVRESVELSDGLWKDYFKTYGVDEDDVTFC